MKNQITENKHFCKSKFAQPSTCFCGMQFALIHPYKLHRIIHNDEHLKVFTTKRETYKMRYMSKGISFLASSSISESRKRACLKSFVLLVDLSDAPI